MAWYASGRSWGMPALQPAIYPWAWAHGLVAGLLPNCLFVCIVLFCFLFCFLQSVSHYVYSLGFLASVWPTCSAWPWPGSQVGSCDGCTKLVWLGCCCCCLLLGSALDRMWPGSTCGVFGNMVAVVGGANPLFPCLGTPRR